MNAPTASRATRGARIWPFKVHRAKQPWDPENRHLVPPVTSGEGGYWHDFNWTQALELGAREAGIPFSGRHAFIETRMYWPLSHMVQPKARALGCDDCHGDATRLDWEALGYAGDPMRTRGAPLPSKGDAVGGQR